MKKIMPFAKRLIRPMALRQLTTMGWRPGHLAYEYTKDWMYLSNGYVLLRVPLSDSVPVPEMIKMAPKVTFHPLSLASAITEGVAGWLPESTSYSLDIGVCKAWTIPEVGVQVRDDIVFVNEAILNVVQHWLGHEILEMEKIGNLLWSPINQVGIMVVIPKTMGMKNFKRELKRRRVK